MSFRSPIVEGTTLVRPAIQSTNFSAGHAGWQIAASGTAEFNNVTIRGGSTVGGTILEYSGTPAAGNLIASIAAAAGVDAYGNHYAAGVVSYDQTNLVFSQINSGTVSVGGLTGLAGAAPDTADAAAFSGGSGVSAVTSGIDGGTAFTDAASMQFVAGEPGKASGSGVNPFVRIQDAAGTSAVDAVLYGSLIAGIVGVGAASWHSPVYAAGWADSTQFDGFTVGEGLRYRKLAEDNVWLYGLTVASAGVGPMLTATGNTLPAGYHSVTHTTFGTVLRNRGGTVTAQPAIVTAGGTIFVGGTPAAGDEYLWNWVYPIENIP